MEIHVNGEPFLFSGSVLADLLRELKRDTDGIAIAIDQQVVPRSQWQKRPMQEQDDVLIFESIAGG